jgi:hypothetical protein
MAGRAAAGMAEYAPVMGRFWAARDEMQRDAVGPKRQPGHVPLIAIRTDGHQIPAPPPVATTGRQQAHSSTMEVIVWEETRDNGGGGGIRTHGTLSRTPVFKTGAFDHSATPPGRPRIARWAGIGKTSCAAFLRGCERPPPGIVQAGRKTVTHETAQCHAEGFSRAWLIVMVLAKGA